MAKKLISEADVHEAATTLVDNDESPTIVAVHAALGRRGSYTTISKYLNTWKEQQEQDADPAAKAAELPVPEVLETAGVNLIKQVWRLTQQLGKEALTDEREELFLREAATEEKVEQVVDRCEELSLLVESLQQQLETSQQALQRETESRHALERQLAQKTEALERSEQANTRLESKLDSLTEKYEHKLEDVARLNTDVSRLNTDVSRLHEELVQEKQQNERLRQNQAETEARLREESGNNKALKDSMHLLQQDRDTLASALKQTEQEVRQLAENKASLLAQQAEKQAQADRQEARLEKAYTTIKQLEEALVIARQPQPAGTEQEDVSPQQE